MMVFMGTLFTLIQTIQMERKGNINFFVQTAKNRIKEFVDLMSWAISVPEPILYEK